MQAMDLFLASIRSPETKMCYSIYFRKYQEFIGMEFEDLFCQNNPRLIEAKIIEFITNMKNEGKGYSTIHNYAAAVMAFYKINDIVLNISKINKFIPPARKARNDRSYTHHEISKLLEIADERVKIMILLMASAGIRQGALPSLRLKHLQDRKLIVYENEPEEYFTFITPECEKGIQSYLETRKRYGEVLTPDTYLIREQFDIRDQFQISRAKPITIGTIKWKMIDIAKRAGVRSKEVKASHSLRKFFTTQLINSKVNPEIREMLLGHRIGLASCYYRPTQEEMFTEYEKAIDALTINEENRLKRKVQMLEVEKSRMDRIELQIQALQNEMKTGSPKLE